jgi:hypothetical protein
MVDLFRLGARGVSPKRLDVLDEPRSYRRNVCCAGAGHRCAWVEANTASADMGDSPRWFRSRHDWGAQSSAVANWQRVPMGV